MDIDKLEHLMQLMTRYNLTFLKMGEIELHAVVFQHVSPPPVESPQPEEPSLMDDWSK